ncbi:hypothetical protein Tco_0627606 [Tanacetum coccineum]|uniref:Uncharacterized protein n=1 Tax=Tanacetum coccineum TaxID=301880 RepID=A0ABQ4WMX9_9ASTR
MPRKNINGLSAMLYEALKEMLPLIVNREVNKIAKTIVNDVVANHIPLQIKFKKITIANPCRTSAIRPRDHEDHQDDDARLEGGVVRRGRKRLNMEPIQIDDDEVPTKEVSQELLEEMSMEIDEAQLQKMQNYLKSDIVWESMKEMLSLSTSKKKALVVHSCQRDPKAPPMTLLNQDMFYLKHGHEHNFIVELIVRRANGKIDSIKEPSYKYLKMNDIEDLYMLCINGKVDNYKETGLLGSLSVFIRSKQEKLLTITSEPVVRLIYKNNKKEKRVMVYKGIHKFCDATLKTVLEKLKRYNKDVKYEYANPRPSDADVDYDTLSGFII